MFLRKTKKNQLLHNKPNYISILSITKTVTIRIEMESLDVTVNQQQYIHLSWRPHCRLVYRGRLCVRECKNGLSNKNDLKCKCSYDLSPCTYVKKSTTKNADNERRS